MGCGGSTSQGVVDTSTSELDQTISDRWSGPLVVSSVILPPKSKSPTAAVPVTDTGYSSDLQQALGISVDPSAAASSALASASASAAAPTPPRSGRGTLAPALPTVPESGEPAGSPGFRKMRVVKSSRVLLVGDHRVKVATARFIRNADPSVEVIVGVRDPPSPENANLKAIGCQLIAVNLMATNLHNSIKRLKQIDAAFVVSPATNSKVQETCHAINALKRAGVSHVIVLSNTVVDCDKTTYFGEQCRSVESYCKQSGLSYTIVRVPMYMDNYCSQIDSIFNNGVFYRPVDPNTRRNIVCIADVGEAVGQMALRPAAFLDKTINLNGPLTSCEQAARAFSKALGKPVVYEKVSRGSYKTMMLNSLIPEWQAEGLLQLFSTYEQQEPYSLQSTADLEEILGRAPVDIWHFSTIVVQKLQTSKQLPAPVPGMFLSNSAASLSDLDSSVGSSIQNPSASNVAGEAGADGLPAAPLSIPRSIRPSIDVSIHPSIGNIAPQGLSGMLNVSIGLKQITAGSSLWSLGGGQRGGLGRSRSSSYVQGGDVSQPSSAADLQSLSKTRSMSYSFDGGTAGAGGELSGLAFPTRTINIKTSGGVMGEIVLPDIKAADEMVLAAGASSLDLGQWAPTTGSADQDASVDGGNGRGERSGSFTHSYSIHGGDLSALPPPSYSSLRLDHYGSKSVVLVDGFFTYVSKLHMPSLSAPSLLTVPTAPPSTPTELLEIGRCNKTFALNGYIVEREDARRFRLVSSRGDDIVYILEAPSEGETTLWLERLQGE